jgi:glucose/arabinose dehydrogenase
MSLRRPVAIATIVLAALPALAQSPGARTAPGLYAQLCAGCHGEGIDGGSAGGFTTGRGRPPPDPAELARIIREGVPAAGMPAFADTLGAAEIHALVVLVRETAARAVSPTPGRARPLPAGVQHSAAHAYRIERVVDGLDVPWSLAFLADGRLLFTERTGALFVVAAENGRWGRPRPIAGVPPVWVRDEGGLLAVAPHPDFARNGWLYFTLSDPGPDDTGTTRVLRARLQGERLVAHEAIFAAPPDSYTTRGVNFGSRLVFDGEHLFFSFGERGEVGQAQDLARPNGKVHRVFHDGRIPPDNPFVATPGALASIWSYGHRNPQGLARNPADGALWETEHGPRGGDELNFVRRGGNYGWPVITYGMNYDATPVSALTHHDGMEQPVLHWTPSIAAAPIHFYTGDAFPDWKNQLFVGALAQQELRRMVVEGDRVVHQETILENLGRVRDIATGPDGFLYVALELPGEPGHIVRLVPAEPAP